MKLIIHIYIIIIIIFIIIIIIIFIIIIIILTDTVYCLSLELRKLQGFFFTLYISYKFSHPR